MNIQPLINAIRYKLRYGITVAVSYTHLTLPTNREVYNTVVDVS